jgi:hypothetical protein
LKNEEVRGSRGGCLFSGCGLAGVVLVTARFGSFVG